MKRNGFTMVELIFVIIIIGILSVAAIPKFGDIKDRAKINAEYSSLSGLDGAIIAAMEFHAEDNDGNIDVLWHGQTDGTLNTEYETIDTGVNQQGAVLSKVVKKGDKLDIVAYSSLDSAGVVTGTDMEYDVIFIEGEASDSSTGVKKDQDTAGKPDRNDVWVFNSSPVDIVVYTYDTAENNKTIESGELALIDVADTTAVNYVDAATTTDGDLWITVGGAARALEDAS